MEGTSNFERGPEYIPINQSPEVTRNKRKRDCSSEKKTNGNPKFPWINPGELYSSVHIIALHEEIEQFYEYIRPTRLEHQMRLDVIKRIKKAVLSFWPQAQIKVFGSFQTSLYLPSSDIDLVVLGKWKALPLWTLRDALITHKISVPSEVKVLDRATVPIVKMTDMKTEVKVDISFNMRNGMESAMFINEKKKEFPNLPKLVMVLKQFLLQRELNEVYTGGISSYSLTLLVISFLQLYPRVDVSAENANLGVLLLEFLEFYGRHFNYNKTAISVKNHGCYFPKDQFQSYKLDSRPSILCIEDPLMPGNDIGRNSYGMMNVKKAFENAYILLASVVHPKYHDSFPGKSILGKIVHMREEIVLYRKRIHESMNFSDLDVDDEIEWLQSPSMSSFRNHPFDSMSFSTPNSRQTPYIHNWKLHNTLNESHTPETSTKRQKTEKLWTSFE